MAADRNVSEGILGPTVDVLAAAVGIGIVTYPLAASGLAALDLHAPTPGAVTLIVAIGGAYPFVAGPWSLRLLGDYVLVWTAAVLALGTGAFLLAVTVGGIPDGFGRLVQAFVFGLAHVIALGSVGGYGLAPTQWR